MTDVGRLRFGHPVVSDPDSSTSDSDLGHSGDDDGRFRAEPVAALALLDAWEKEDATDDREELEKRLSEWTSLEAAMNEGHSSQRILFP